MRAGKLDRKIAILRNGDNTDEFNESTDDWPVFVEVAAQQRPVRGGERFSAQQTAGGAVLTFHIRWRGDLKLSDRVLYEGRLFDVQDIREIGRRKVTEIDVTERGELLS